MLNKIFKSVLIGIFALVMIVTVTSCEKEKETIGIIIVKRNGVVVPNAAVTLFPKAEISPQGILPDPSLTKINNTDANGQAEFTYALEAILNIEVVKYEGNDTLKGSNIIRLLKEKIVTKEVEIN